MSSVAVTVKELLARESKSGLSAEQISEADSLTSKLRVDSLTFIRVVVALEDGLGIQFDDEKIMNTAFATVGELIDYVAGMAKVEEGV